MVYSVWADYTRAPSTLHFIHGGAVKLFQNHEKEK